MSTKSLHIKSLHIKSVKKTYSKELIKYILWKNFLGSTDRVDFVPIINSDGTEDETHQQAFIYAREDFNWDKNMIETIENKEFYELKFTNSEQKNGGVINESWKIFNNLHPIPYANTIKNIHQLHNENITLKEKITKLEEQLEEAKKYINKLNI